MSKSKISIHGLNSVILFFFLFSDMDAKLECCIRLSTWTKSHEKENLGRLNLSQATYYLLEYV
jgi:hypothetical protein